MSDSDSLVELLPRLTYIDLFFNAASEAISSAKLQRRNFTGQGKIGIKAKKIEREKIRKEGP